MKRIKGINFLLFLLMSLVVLTFYPASGWAAAEQGLSSGDCAKCHVGPPADIAAKGASHQ